MLDLSGLEAMVQERIPYALPFAWKTGTTGWYAADKVTTDDGKRYQVQVNGYIIGSKEAKSAKPREAIPLAALMCGAHLLPHTWKTGTTGALLVTKQTVGADRVQVQVNCFAIGSAPKSAPIADKASAKEDAREAKSEAKRATRKASAKRMRQSIEA